MPLIYQKKEHQICIECKKARLVRDNTSGEIVCPNCGVVFSSTIIDRTPEWRAFNLQEKNSLPRTGLPLKLSIPDFGLSSKIDWRNKDYKGKKLNLLEKEKNNRLRIWDNRSKTHTSPAKNLVKAASCINILCKK